MVIPMRVDGADVSHHQGELNLSAARDAGLKFLYHKATEGATFVDKEYAARRNAAHNVGIPFGAYHFARPERGDALTEARHFLKIASPKPGDLFPVLDLEDHGTPTMSRAELTTWVGAFVGEVLRHTGIRPIIYTQYDLDRNFGCMLWTSRYSNTNAAPPIPEPWKMNSIHQFSDGRLGVPKSFPGLGNVDLNTLIPPTTVKSFTIPPKEAPMPTPAPKKTQIFAEIFADCNLKALGLMRQPYVESDIQSVKRLNASAIGWQELGWPDRYVRALWRLMPPTDRPGHPDWSHSFVPGESCGISYDQNIWQPVDSADRLLLHGAKRGVTDERHYLAQDFRHIASRVIVRIIVGHWAPKRDGEGVSLQREGNATMISEIKRTIRRGVPVILLMDGNQTGHPLGREIDGQPVRQKSGIVGGGIDKIVCVAPEGYDFVLPKSGFDIEKGLNSDHDAIAQRVHYFKLS